MKRAIPIVLMLAAIAAGIFFYLRTRPDADRSTFQLAELAPADTALFVELPDVARTLKRWEDTALAQIGNEPEWRDFAGKLDDYLFAAMEQPGLGEAFALLKEADLDRLFFATCDPYGNQKDIGGFSYRGKRSVVKAAMEKWRQVILSGQAAQKSELVTFEGTEIESITGPGTKLAFAYRDNWFFITMDVESMRETLRRYSAAATAPPSLAREAQFQDARQQALPEADLLVYSNLRRFEESSARALAARSAQGNSGAFPAMTPQPDIVEKLFYSAKLEGRNFHGRVYLHVPSAPRTKPTSHRLAALGGEDLVAGISANVEGAESWWADLLQETGIEVGNVEALLVRLESKGIQASELKQIFGPELAMHSEWPVIGILPTFSLVAEVRNIKRAREVIAALEEIKSPGETLAKKEERGTTYWTWVTDGDVTQPTLALNDRHAVYALNFAAAAEVVKRLEENENRQPSPALESAVKLLPPNPSVALTIDTRKLLATVYPKVRPFLVTEIAGDETAQKFLDHTKFPPEEVLGRHLGPIVATYHDAKDGFAVECMGPLPGEVILGAAPMAWFFYLMSSPPIPSPAVGSPSNPARIPATPGGPAAPELPK